jgi:hypothetical protein
MRLAPFFLLQEIRHDLGLYSTNSAELLHDACQEYAIYSSVMHH